MSVANAGGARAASGGTMAVTPPTTSAAAGHPAAAGGTTGSATSAGSTTVASGGNGAAPSAGSGTGASGSGTMSMAGSSPSTAGSMAAAGAGGPGAGGLNTATDPIIPEPMGDCPEFKAGTGTVTVMGIPATVFVGDKKEGTGSFVAYFYGTAHAGDVSFLPQAVKDDVMKDGGIVFAPNAAMNTGGDCSGTGTFGIDDFKVIDQAVACAVKNYGINPKRIYATGCSAGGLTTGCIGIMRSNYIAAVAPNSGGITIGYGKLQNPQHMPNAITMNGGGGDNVIVNFGQTSEGYDNYVLKYGGFAVNCIHNSGHCGAPPDLYASAWQFLKDHPFGIKPEPYANGLPSGFNSVCKIFEMTSMAPIGGF